MHLQIYMQPYDGEADSPCVVVPKYQLVGYLVQAVLGPASNNRLVLYMQYCYTIRLFYH